MWQKSKQDSAIFRLALLLAVGTMPMAVNLLVPKQILAQSATDAPAFPLPTTVENGTTVRIDGSSALNAINQNLKQSFEQQFSGSKVEVQANGTEAALKAVLDGSVDIAALGRGLTKEERAQGLEQVRLYREKIAVIVSADNPFQGGLSSREFARIFRGRITDWSEVGGVKGKIRLIDRPTTSDTRNTFRTYPAFKAATFATGSTATQVTDDNTVEIVKQLGNDGISYALANQVSQIPGVRVVPIDKATPTDEKYVFSQPLVYVYKKNPSLGAASFLGFAIAPPGLQAIETARTSEAAAIAQGQLPTLATANAPTPEATTVATNTSPVSEATTTTADANTTAAPNESSVNSAASNNGTLPTPLLILLPLLLLGGLGSWFVFSRKKPSPEAETADKDVDSVPTAPPSQPTFASTSTEDVSINEDNAWDTEAPAAVVNTSYPHIPEAPATNSDLAKEEEPSLSTENSGEQVVASDIQNAAEEQPQLESNNVDAIASIGGAALGGAAIAAGVADAAANSTEQNTSIGNSNYSIWDAPESELPVMDTAGTIPTDVTAQTAAEDLPVIETAGTIPDVADVTEQTAAEDLPVIETAATIPDLPDIPEQTADVDLPVIETAATIPDLPDIPEQTTDVDLPVIETAATIPDTADVQDSALDAVADAAESFPDDTEEEIIEIVSNFPEQTAETSANAPEDVSLGNLGALAGGAAAAAGVGIGAWASISGNNPDVEVNDNTSDAPVETAEVSAATNGNVKDSVNLRPHTPKWAYASWHISDNEKQAIEDADSRLALRLYDVTDIDLSYQTPHLVQQYECDDTAQDRFIAIPASDRNYFVEIGYVTTGDRWVKIAHSPTVRVFSNPALPGEDNDDDLADNLQDSITFTYQSAKSAQVSWQISDVNKQVLQQSGRQLGLRLYDVTGIDLSYQTPQFIQQYEFDSATESSVIEIPVSDRNYIAEIGYAADGENWIAIARSQTVRFFSPVGTEDPENAGLLETDPEPLESTITLTPRTAKWAYVTWYFAEAEQQLLNNSEISQLTIKLYDVTSLDLSYQHPQLVQQYDCEVFSGDRFVAIPNSDRDYIVEIGYQQESEPWVTLARSSTVRVFSRPYPDFWFVADAEIIIHGATEPDATVNIAGHPIKLKPDGTFHFRIPYSDSLIEYLMTATSANGQTRSIHKKFSQENPEV
ncbi:DUF4912 domain-containing protein [Calothrix sp. FACHB-1219]|uniref:DUF4912 domain-containing protein n=1 Tax=unclassified Calothrix TaxID=2619626 RepID=UPI00168772AF|nr:MULTISPECIES: DUF4912 domain-containing protein [unclassified Calothrix]MBD2205105.1 DUF4912 domain-containing protein [Calothrix sp. FACHB-168]MBD2216511.1 DUF4912 domain-containing protein [Calothrix sp. FACHB-1219]